MNSIVLLRVEKSCLCRNLYFASFISLVTIFHNNISCHSVESSVMPNQLVGEGKHCDLINIWYEIQANLSKYCEKPKQSSHKLNSHR